MVADVGVPPQRTTHGVGVGLHEAGEEDAVRVAVVDPALAVPSELLEAPHGADPVVHDRYRLCGGP